MTRDAGAGAVGFVLLMTVLAGAAYGEEAPPAPADLSFTVGARLWASTGYFTMSASVPGLNPLSELRWRGVDSLVPELNADLVWKRLVVTATAGYGLIEDGVLIDEDFALDDHQGRFSRTRSSVEDDHLFYASGDIGARVVRWASADGRPGHLDVLAGYQYWREKYVAFGATGIFDATVFGEPGVFDNVIPSGVKALTHDARWQSVRVGGRWAVPFPAGFGFRAQVFFIPWSSFELQDTHHLRNDLRQDPSFLSKAKGGFGYQVEGALSYTVWRGLAVEGGFRYMKLDSGDGDTDVRALTGTTRIKFEGATLERYGPFVGLQYRF